jgi:hypothetical protein
VRGAWRVAKEASDVSAAMALLGSVDWLVLALEGWTMIPLVRVILLGQRGV